MANKGFTGYAPITKVLYLEMLLRKTRKYRKVQKVSVQHRSCRTMQEQHSSRLGLF